MLIQDPNQDVHQLLTKFAGTSSSSSSSSAPASKPTHKRHVTSSSHDSTSSVPPLETFEVASDAQPAKGNPTATSASAAAAPTSSTAGMSSRTNCRKSSSVSSISLISSGLPPISSVGSKAPTNVTQAFGGFSVRVSSQNLSATVGGGESKSSYHHHGLSSQESHHGEPSMSVHSAVPPVSRVPASGPVSVKSASHQPAGGGAVRRLFTSASTLSAQLVSSPPASAPNPSSLANSTWGGTTSGVVVSVVQTPAGHSVLTGKGSSMVQAPGSGRPQVPKCSTRPHETSSGAGTNRQSGATPHSVVVGGCVDNEKPAAVPVHVHKSQVVIGGPAAVSMSYSRAINAAPVPTAAVQENSQQLQPPVEVIEQPLQQIMKAPTIFQDPPAPLAKAKKKSTYSDAVVKKTSGGTGVSSGGSVVISGAPPAVVAMTTVVPASAIAGSGGVFVSSGSGSVIVGSSGVLQAVPASSQQMSTSGHQPKINRAPGSRPTAEKVHVQCYMHCVCGMWMHVPLIL